MIHIVKRAGHTEKFDERKVYGSVYAACLNTHLAEAEAEKIADQVSQAIVDWIKTKNQITSRAIFQKVIDELKAINNEAAFMYETHRDLS